MSKIVHVIKSEHKRILYSFLKANNALKQFKENCRHRGRDFDWLTSAANYHLPDVIDYAFYWADQPEGSLFWRGISHKWQGYIQRHKSYK